MIKTNFLNFLFSILAFSTVLVACERGSGVPEPVEGYNPAGGLLLHYDFVNGATDKGEHKYDGEIIGAPEEVDGRKDAALFLNETDGDNGCDQLGGQYVQLPLIEAVWEKGFSIVAWVEFKEVRNYERIFDMGNGLGETSGYNVTFSRLKETNDLALTSWVNADSAYNRVNGRLVAKNAIVNGELQHYAATISPEGTMKIFVNGIKVAERNDGNEVLNVSRERNYLGHSSYCYIDPDLKGVIDDFRLYNKPLSEQEVKDLYKN